ncbi:hypothetical protein [Moraxella lacunata]|uniref:hypothetical protein n=1 Tax=Moraxella lacunata TaxID=477 RepID=UPI003EDFBF06
MCCLRHILGGNLSDGIVLVKWHDLNFWYYSLTIPLDKFVGENHICPLIRC